MPRYSGDQIYQNGAYGELVSPTALNYRKATGSSNFGTRKLAWYTVWMDPDYGLAANYSENNSLYYQIVRAIQQGGPGVGGANGYPTTDGTVLAFGGGGAELFYVGTPQNSVGSLINQVSNQNAYAEYGWLGIKPNNFTENFSIVSIAGNTPSAGFATITFTNSGAVPFNVGSALFISGTESYDTAQGYPVYITAVTQTTVTFASEASANDGAAGYVQADLGLDCFVFAIVDDAEPLLPLGNNGFSSNTTVYTGVAGDIECYCEDDLSLIISIPFNFQNAIGNVLVENDLSTSGSVWSGSSFSVFRCQDSFGIFPNFLTDY